jgi:Neutral/alkaline non-lysosomal ceramidase, N-terminal
MFTAGFSKVCISPPAGAPLAGFAARQGVAEGIHDDLFARALVISNDDATIAFISVDVLALPAHFVERVRPAINERAGIRPEAVMIASTHTHAGPVTITTFFNPDESLNAAYMDRLAEAIVESVAAAWRERFPARVGVGAGHVTGIGVNRRTPDKLPVDEEVGIIKVEDAAGRTRAVLINHACHPTVLGPDNLLVTGDFPAFAIEKIEAALDPGGFAMFTNGTQGNISVGHSSELSAIGVVTPGRTFGRAAELGHRLGDAALAALRQIETVRNPALGAISLLTDLPLKTLPAMEEAERALREADQRLSSLPGNQAAEEEINRAKSERLYASITRFYAKETSALNGHLPVELQGLRIGDAAFIAVPAEVFVEIGLQIKARAPYRSFIVGIANGYIGYLTTRAAHAVGGYEVVSSKVAPEAEDVLIEKMLELERKLFSQPAERKKQ